MLAGDGPEGVIVIKLVHDLIVGKPSILPRLNRLDFLFFFLINLDHLLRQIILMWNGIKKHLLTVSYLKF